MSDQEKLGIIKGVAATVAVVFLLTFVAKLAEIAHDWHVCAQVAKAKQ